MRNLDLLNELAYQVGKMEQKHHLAIKESVSGHRIALLAQKLGQLSDHSVINRTTNDEIRKALMEMAAICVMEIEEIDRFREIRRELDSSSLEAGDWESNLRDQFNSYGKIEEDK